MKMLRYISTFVLCTLSLCTFSQDYTRLSERTIMGTARYVGMGGAMTAIGGDPSAVRDNPAGLGLYRHTEVLLTMEYANEFAIPQGSWVISIPANVLTESGAQFHNLMISYHRTHSYMREWKVSSTNTNPSLGAQLPTLDIPFCAESYNSANAMTFREYGLVHEFDFSWGSNFSNKWYAGAGLHIQNYAFSSYGDYTEWFNTYNVDGKQLYNQNVTTLRMNGASVNATFGVIYRPLSWLRLGFGIETPSFGSINTYTVGTLTAQTDSLRASSMETSSRDKSYHQPFRTTFSTAFQVGAYGLFALQYDYAHASFMDDRHSIRIGIETIPILGLYINLGYAYESTFKPYKAAAMDPKFDRQDTYSVCPRADQYASVAFGYRGTHMIAQLAYQFHWQQTAFFTHPTATPYDVYQNTHRIVLTLGWHHN